MRESYLEKFDRIWIDCLNGDSYKTGKVTPDGKPDPSVFSTEWNRERIQVGTSIGLLVRNRRSKGTGTIHLRQFWGKAKREELLASIGEPIYESISPAIDLGLSFMSAKIGENYRAWPPLPSLFPTSFPGVKTSRDQLLIDVDKEDLVRRMQSFFDPKLSYEEWHLANQGLAENVAGFDPKSVRTALVLRGFQLENIVRFQYRPFDVRWLYWEPETNLLDRKREDYFPHVGQENRWIEARQRQPKEIFDRGFVTRFIADNFGNGLSNFFPLRLKTEALHGPLLKPSSGSAETPNLSDDAWEYLAALKRDPEDLFFHAVAMINDPAYRSENAGALRQDWPHVPLPISKQALIDSADLGRQIARLFDCEVPIKQITSGDLRAELKPIAVTTRVGGGSLKETDLELTAGWGHSGKGGVTMPGRGKLLEREYSIDEQKSIIDGARAIGITEENALRHLGDKTCDVYLNDDAYWCNVPTRVWEYTIGGYQVIKKWLSYREKPLLGRALTVDEVRYVQEMARRIAAILLLEPALDANYESIKANTFSWPPKS